MNGFVPWRNFAARCRAGRALTTPTPAAGSQLACGAMAEGRAPVLWVPLFFVINLQSRSPSVHSAGWRAFKMPGPAEAAILLSLALLVLDDGWSTSALANLFGVSYETLKSAWKRERKRREAGHTTPASKRQLRHARSLARQRKKILGEQHHQLGPVADLTHDQVLRQKRKLQQHEKAGKKILRMGLAPAVPAASARAPPLIEPATASAPPRAVVGGDGAMPWGAVAPAVRYSRPARRGRRSTTPRRQLRDAGGVDRHGHRQLPRKRYRGAR